MHIVLDACLIVSQHLMRDKSSIFEKYSNLGSLRPQNRIVKLPPGNLQLNVVCFNFTSMLSSLLNDISINKMTNLVVNKNNRFGEYRSSTGNLGEVNSGS